MKNVKVQIAFLFLAWVVLNLIVIAFLPSQYFFVKGIVLFVTGLAFLEIAFLILYKKKHG
jgi:hypothetical protein